MSIEHLQSLENPGALIPIARFSRDLHITILANYFNQNKRTILQILRNQIPGAVYLLDTIFYNYPNASPTRLTRKMKSKMYYVRIMFRFTDGNRYEKAVIAANQFKSKLNSGSAEQNICLVYN